jgi:uncharacterized protein YcbK (DUF882 family)
MEKLSIFFTREEFEYSETAKTHNINNILPSEYLHNAKTLCAFTLDKIRGYIDTSIHINSGYRGPLVNKIVGGVKTSAHSQGRAADIVVKGKTPKELFMIIHKLYSEGVIPTPDQVILEPTWVHIGINAVSRNQWLQFDGKTYTNFKF